MEVAVQGAEDIADLSICRVGSMTLPDWHKRLLAHFERLAAERSVDARRRVFVLEHGLDSSEVTALQTAVRAAVLARKPDSMMALPWLVYATELGYRYSGDEYWQTFEEETPGWAGVWDRGWLRDQFLWFHRKLHGIQPIGPWAQHFSIICWPIASAVLPRDLQLQLARILFEMRYSLNQELFGNPEKLGREIAYRSWSASKRFQNLCEDPLLIGQIGTALLLEGQAGTASLILPATLRRIGGDLNREQQSKEWLKKARGVAIERLNVKGLAPTRGSTGHPKSPRTQAEDVSRIAIEPKLLLRPSLVSLGAWSVFLQIPNLAPLVEVVPESRAVLTEGRCEVVGASGRPLARGRLLQGTQLVPLDKWPEPGQPLLKFDKKDAQFEYIVRSCFSMSALRPWLFRVASDGLAYALRNAGVRVREKYLLLGGNVEAGKLSFASPVTIEAAGVTGVILEIPAVLQQETINALKKLGVAVAPSIRVWPAGVGAIEWDGQGRSEWLVTERPCFGIRADHSLASVSATLDGRRYNFGSLSAGVTIFISCPPMSQGHHEIELIGKEGPFVPEASVGKLDVYLRPARAWEGGKGSHGPLLVDVEPFSPTFEQLREGRVDVGVRGPNGRELDVVVRIFQRNNETPIFNRRLVKLALPITPESWNRYIQKHVFKLQEVEELYDVSSLCDIELNGGELGSISLRFERESVPVRWAVRTAKGRKKQISIISDAAQEGPVEFESRSFENPDTETRRGHVAANAWSEVPAQGGLFLARVGQFSSAIVLPPEVHGLSDFQLTVSIAKQVRALQSVIATLNSIRVWAAARQSGNFLSGARQRAVLRALTADMYSILCGEAWERVERTDDENPPATALKILLGKPQEFAIAKVVVGELESLVESSPTQRTHWLCAHIYGAHASSDEQWLCEFALRLASDPGHVEKWSGNGPNVGVEKLWAQPHVARIARLMAIAVDRHASGSHQTIGQLYSGWAW